MLRHGAAEQLLNATMAAAADWAEVHGDAQMKLFFVGRNVPGNATHKWWSKAKLDIEKQIFMRQVEEGEQSDHSCTAVHLPHLRRMLKAFARVDKWECLMNRAILHTTWCTFGRASEAAWLTFNSMLFDASQKLVYQAVPQLKVIKWKFVSIVGGNHRNLCWYATMAGYMMARGLSRWAVEPDCIPWLFPTLGQKHPAGAVTDIVHSIKAAGGRKDLQPVCLSAEKLPTDATAGGFRKGVIQLLFRSEYPVTRITVCTGHASEIDKAVHHYVDAEQGETTPGACRVAGWGPMPPACGDAPTLPDFLKVVREIDSPPLDTLMDWLFNLGSSCKDSPKHLWRGERLRPFVRMCFESLVMWYNDFVEHQEFYLVRERLIEGVRTQLSKERREAEEDLKHWSALMKAEWKARNLRITAPQPTPGRVLEPEAVVNSVTGMHESLKENSRQQHHIVQHQHTIVEGVTHLIAGMSEMKLQGSQHAPVTQQQVSALDAKLDVVLGAVKALTVKADALDKKVNIVGTAVAAAATGHIAGADVVGLHTLTNMLQGTLTLNGSVPAAPASGLAAAADDAATDSGLAPSADAAGAASGSVAGVAATGAASGPAGRDGVAVLCPLVVATALQDAEFTPEDLYHGWKMYSQGFLWGEQDKKTLFFASKFGMYSSCFLAKKLVRTCCESTLAVRLMGCGVLGPSQRRSCTAWIFADAAPGGKTCTVLPRCSM